MNGAFPASLIPPIVNKIWTVTRTDQTTFHILVWLNGIRFPCYLIEIELIETKEEKLISVWDPITHGLEFALENVQAIKGLDGSSKLVDGWMRFILQLEPCGGGEKGSKFL